MLGTTLTKDEVEEFMREADVVYKQFWKFVDILALIFNSGWKWKTGLWWIRENDADVLVDVDM